MIYNLKSKTPTQEHIYKDTEELIADILDSLHYLRVNETISVYTNRRLAADIATKLDYYQFDSETSEEQFLEPRKNGLILTITIDNTISISPIYYREHIDPVNAESVINFIHDTHCKTEVLKMLEYNNENILCFCLEEELE